MKWRDILIGSLATLTVTVLGGVLLYYLTRESPPPTPREILVYELDSPMVFDSDQTTMSFITIRVKNTGNKSAANVLIGIEFEDTVKITDHRESLSSGPAGHSEPKLTSNNKLEVRVQIFAPNEVATIAILTDTADGSKPTVGLKSDSSIGTRASLTTSIGATRAGTARTSQVFGFLVPLAMTVQLVLLLLMRNHVVQILRRFLPTGRSVNNTAFLFLHGGLTDQAVELLSKGIEETGADPYMLANYGLALGLKGETEQSKKVLDASEFWAGTNTNERALAEFNRSILSFKQNDNSEGLKKIEKAFSLSKSTIRRYAKYSLLISELRAENPDLNSFLNDNGVKPQTGQ